MSTYRFPVLVWQDFEGYYTASLVEEHEAHETVAMGESEQSALSQLQECLSWQFRRHAYFSEPDFLEPRLVNFTVQVRPEYHRGDRIFPCSEPVPLRVPCVQGHQEGGLLVCSLPTMRHHFYYYEPKQLRGLIVHYVQERLKGLTPRELSRYLPPRSVSLAEVAVRVSRKRRRAQYAPEFPVLSAVAEPLDAAALRRQFSKPLEREDEAADLVERIRREKANVLLVGESGVGKTSVLAEAVRRLVREQPDAEDADGEDREERSSSLHRRFWLTSSSRLIAGMRYLGEWQERCEQVIEELSECDGFLCVEDLLDLVRVGGQGPGDSVAAFLLPYVERGELRLIAEATPAELDACRRMLFGFVSSFQILNVPEFDRAAAQSILEKIADSNRLHLGIGMEKRYVSLVHRLFSRFVPYQAFPGRAAAFMRRLFERAEQQKSKELTLDDVVDAFTSDTGLPELFLRDDLLLSQDEVEGSFTKRVIGQDDACRAAARVVTTFKAGLNDPDRPVGVLLFCGPTGVGKTELARTISRFLFEHGEEKDRLVRLDMSEYAGPGAAARFLGEQDDEPSDLIKKLRQQPFAVVLLDEIEKASPEIFDLLLAVLDEGRLTDKWGRTTVFRSAVIIMTSNLGAEKQEAIGFGPQTERAYDEDVMAFFRPEFYNRLDAVVTFHPLDQGTVHAITTKELREIAQREGLKRAALHLTWSDAVVDHLAQKGFDRRYGARPLQRTLERLVVTPLARYFLENPDLRDMEICMDLGADADLVFGSRSARGN